MKIKLNLSPDHPPSVRAILSTVPELTTATARDNSVVVNGERRPLIVLPRPQPGIPEIQGAQGLASKVPAGAVGVVVASAIPERERHALESCGLSWADGRGAIHLSWPGTVVHINRMSERRAGRLPDEDDGLGPTSLRAVQVMLANMDEQWTVARLAQRAAISTGQAHKVFKALERSQLLDAQGAGPQMRRWITDRNRALDWLLMTDRKRRRPQSVRTFLYGRSTADLLITFDERARAAGVRYAVTAAAATDVLGIPVLTSVPTSTVRIADVPLTEVLHRLELEDLVAEEGGRGSNLELWEDVGELGTYDSTELRGIRVAPAIRVWLDLARLGGREADAAQTFREQIIERV